jgi:hypothetical protein
MAAWSDLPERHRRYGVRTRARANLLTLQTNGVKVIAGRTVFYSTGADTITCPHCRQVTALTDNSGNSTNAWHNLARAIDAWATTGQRRASLPGLSTPRRSQRLDLVPAMGIRPPRYRILELATTELRLPDRGSPTAWPPNHAPIRKAVIRERAAGPTFERRKETS